MAVDAAQTCRSAIQHPRHRVPLSERHSGYKSETCRQEASPIRTRGTSAIPIAGYITVQTAGCHYLKAESSHGL